MTEAKELTLAERTRTPEKDEQAFMAIQRMQSNLLWLMDRTEIPHANDAWMALSRLHQQMDVAMQALADPDFVPEQIVLIAE